MAIKYNVMKELNNQVINFFIGLTGSGKSTIVNHCQGLELQCVKSGSSYHIFPIIP